MSDGRPEWTPEAFLKNVLGDIDMLDMHIQHALGSHAVGKDGSFEAKEAARFAQKIQDNLSLYFAEVRRREAKRSGS